MGHMRIVRRTRVSLDTTGTEAESPVSSVGKISTEYEMSLIDHFIKGGDLGYLLALELIKINTCRLCL
jgi:hypothetical protein